MCKWSLFIYFFRFSFWHFLFLRFVHCIFCESRSLVHFGRFRHPQTLSKHSSIFAIWMWVYSYGGVGNRLNPFCGAKFSTLVYVWDWTCPSSQQSGSHAHWSEPQLPYIATKRQSMTHDCCACLLRKLDLIDFLHDISVYLEPIFE